MLGYWPIHILQILYWSYFLAGADRAREIDTFFAHLEAKYAEPPPPPSKKNENIKIYWFHFSAGADRAREMDNFFAHLEAKYAEPPPLPSPKMKT